MGYAVLRDEGRAQPLDQRAFRDALGRFATGVTVVTSRTRSGRICGVTVNSFSSLSLDPPLVLWSLAASSSSHAAFDEASHFVVHVLAEGQDGLARQFARSGIDRFAGIETEEGPQGIPMLPGVAARFECRMLYRYWGGDHVIFVGRVDGFTQAPECAPLVFHAGAMRRLEADERL
ncbi:flavin reductase family protein [Phreatobacter stygius]|uniref:Flavin reductase family protein n=1 Tax=Phreatobacter stygius TaxID=1940610 RepID=A0A4D7B513_9HYPH|nr:flavin reductase family protein [Phreatobacter stygius]QCI63312.1 flavin reductase family protein [Phreatobacter stygius]